MGATEILRSTEVLCFSTDSAIFTGFSIYGVSASFLRVFANLALASATKMLPEFVVAPGGLALAHILARMRGSRVRYTANIRIKKNGVIVHRESKTFELRSAAEKWAKAREVALEDPTALIRVKHGRTRTASTSRTNMVHQYGCGEEEGIALTDRMPLKKLEVGLLTPLPLRNRLECVDIPLRASSTHFGSTGVPTERLPLRTRLEARNTYC